MYNDHFGLKELPFSIAPDPRFLYMSEQHKEALAHLVYGLNSEGGCILFTGEVGAGKTTICRCLIDQIPEDSKVALVLNPKVSAIELLATICDEFRIDYSANDSSVKTLVDAINRFLLDEYANGRKTVVILEEAQNLEASVLEQLRLLTNLETNHRKLMQIVMLGQPELLDILDRDDMRQLSQRVTARFHLNPLGFDEVDAYITHRLSIAGTHKPLFNKKAVRRVYQLSHGVPRLINVICDRSLLGAYVQNRNSVDKQIVEKAASEVFGTHKNRKRKFAFIEMILSGGAMILASASLAIVYFTTAGTGPIVPAQVDPTIIATTDVINNFPVHDPGTRAIANPTPTESDNTGDQVVDTVAGTTTENVTRVIAVNDLVNNPGTHSRTLAYRALFDLWGIKYSSNKNGQACKFAISKNLRCLHKQGNMNSLIKLNRPAILTLYNEQGEKVSATLASIDNKHATLIVNGIGETVLLDELDNHWYGKYTLMWQLPPYYEKDLRPGDSGEVVQWLDQQLAKIKGANASNRITLTYKDPLVSTIKSFQHQRGLIPDGVAGPFTFIQINTEIYGDIPLLLSNRETAS